MTNNPYQNEQRKREFFEHLRGAEGFAETSVNSFAEAIALWQTFSENDDFINFNKSKALAYRDWLKAKETKTEAGKLSIVTQYNYLRRVKRFFKWLSGQPNYQNKVLKNDVEFLRLSKKDARVARQGTTRQMPTFEEAKKIIETIEPRSPIDYRDRAMISFALTTGIRISAIVSLKIKHFDPVNLLIDQNPGDGVKTKNSKKILTTFFPIGWEQPQKYFLDWYAYLKSEGFRGDDPIFPATLKHSINKSTYSKEYVGSSSWSDAGAARKIFEKRCKNADVPYFHPHSFRHLVVSILSKNRFTEEEKKAVSLNLGHANVGTTFGSYGYGNMSEEDAVKIVQKLTVSQSENSNTIGLSDAEKSLLEGLMKKML